MSSTDQLAQIYELHRQFYGTSADTSSTRPHTAHQPIIPPLDDDEEEEYSVLPTPYAIPSTTPISIPQRSSQSSNDDASRSYLESCQPLIEQGLESYRRRRQPPSADIFRTVDWKNSHSEVRERDNHREPSLKRAPSAGSSASGSSKVKAHKDNANAGIFRKTSVRYGKISRALKDYSLGSRSRRQSASSDMMEGVEASTPVSEKENTPQHKGIGRFVGSNKLISSLKTARQDTPQPVNGEMPRSVPIHSCSSSQKYSAPQFPSDCSAGEAARKAAAASNGVRFSQPNHQQSRSMKKAQYTKRMSVCSNPGASDSGAELASNPDIDMLDDVSSEDEADFIAVDPVAVLPTEIVTLIFSHLDPKSLKACRNVSKSWGPLTKDALLWRGQYLQAYQKQNYVSPAPIQIGGVGVGLPEQPLQQWERMYNARKKIDKNWARGDQGGKGVYLAGHTDSVYCVQFDEHKIITGSRDRTIRVWDINTLKCLKVIGGPTVRPGPGPKVLRTVEYPKFHHAEASVNGTAYGESIYHVPSDFHSASILCLQYDDEILVTGSSDNDLLIWDVKTWEPIRRLKQHTGGVLDVAFDDKHIISCSKDCSIIVWDRKTLEPIRTLNGHRGPVNAVQLRGNLLVSASGDGVARLWDLNKMDCVREFPPKERGLAAVEFSDDAKYVLAGGNDHITYKFDVATGAEVKTFTGHSQLVRSLFLDTQNRRVVSGSYDLDLRVYDYDSGELLGRFAEWTTSWMLAAKCDYRRIVSTSQDGRILIIDFGLDERGNKIDGVDLLRGF